jgi:hypothetical protein
MIGRPRVVRRRPLLRAAAVGGTFAAGRATGRRAGQQAAAEAAQDSSVRNQAQPTVPAQESAASSEAAMMDQLSRLSMLHQDGALTDDEFATAKAKVLGS